MIMVLSIASNILNTKNANNNKNTNNNNKHTTNSNNNNTNVINDINNVGYDSFLIGSMEENKLNKHVVFDGWGF